MKKTISSKESALRACPSRLGRGTAAHGEEWDLLLRAGGIMQASWEAPPHNQWREGCHH